MGVELLVLQNRGLFKNAGHRSTETMFINYRRPKKKKKKDYGIQCERLNGIAAKGGSPKQAVYSTAKILPRGTDRCIAGLLSVNKMMIELGKGGETRWEKVAFGM